MKPVIIKPIAIRRNKTLVLLHKKGYGVNHKIDTLLLIVISAFIIIIEKKSIISILLVLEKDKEETSFIKPERLFFTN